MRLTPISFYFGGTSTLEKKGTRTVVHMHAVGEKMCATLFVAIDNSGEMMAPSWSSIGQAKWRIH
jgi:hypothetical protein